MTLVLLTVLVAALSVVTPTAVMAQEKLRGDGVLTVKGIGSGDEALTLNLDTMPQCSEGQFIQYDGAGRFSCVSVTGQSSEMILRFDRAQVGEIMAALLIVMLIYALVDNWLWWKRAQ